MKKNSLISLVLSISFYCSAQEVIGTTSASYTFYQGSETINLENPKIKSLPLQFKIESRKKIVAVSYEATLGHGAEVVSVVHEVTRVNTINYNRSMAAPKDRIAVKIILIEDEAGRNIILQKTCIDLYLNNQI